MHKSSLIVLVCLVATSASAEAQLPRHRARPGLLPGIPTYPYKTVEQRVPDTVTIVSLGRVTSGEKAVVGSPTATSDTRVASFQMLEQRVQIDHCFLSNVAVSFSPDGSYTVSFRADQNPQTNNDVRSPLKPGEKAEHKLETNGLMRNTFKVSVRAYGVAPLREFRPNLAAAKPVLFEIALDPFTVEKAQPYNGTVNKTSDLVRRHYDLIDRVEVEFTYR